MIELVIRLEDWKQTVEYDRVGLSDRTTSVLGVRVPEIVMPVRPGHRNLAVLGRSGHAKRTSKIPRPSLRRKRVQ